MKQRTPWVIVGLLALTVAAVLMLRDRPTSVTSAAEANVSAERSPTGFSPDRVSIDPPTLKSNVVEIQDGKTIDFSSGLPIIKDSEKDQAALARAVKEMEEAAAEVSFGARTAPEKQ